MLTIAVSSRTLFNVEDGHQIFIEKGQDAFDEYMKSKADVPMRPGPAFETVTRLLKLNAGISDVSKQVQVVVLSRNSVKGGIRIMNSIHYYGLPIERTAFCSGTDRFRYAEAFEADLFLSANAEDVAAALKNGLAAATLLPKEHTAHVEDSDEIRLAFDGDAVLFSTESDDQYREKGLAHFREYELVNADKPLEGGPFKNVLHKLHAIQKSWPAGKCPLRTALITARGVPAHHRVVATLDAWDIHMDEVVFAGGFKKGPILRAFGAHIFFDDTRKNTDSAEEYGIVAGHVPFGSGQGIVAP